MRAFLRKATTWLLAGFVGMLLFGVCGEWLIHVADDKGWYRDAGEKWDRAVSAVEAIFSGMVVALTSTPALVGLGLVVGLRVGLWAEKFLRAREGQAISQLTEDRIIALIEARAHPSTGAPASSSNDEWIGARVIVDFVKAAQAELEEQVGLWADNWGQISEMAPKMERAAGWTLYADRMPWRYTELKRPYVSIFQIEPPEVRLSEIDFEMPDTSNIPNEHVRNDYRKFYRMNAVAQKQIPFMRGSLEEERKFYQNRLDSYAFSVFESKRKSRQKYVIGSNGLQALD